MNYNILILIIYSVIFILIVHLLIKHILLREKIYKKVNLIKNNDYSDKNELPIKDIEENFIEGENVINENNCIDGNINIVKNEIDNENMEKQLLDYMRENEDIYKDKTEIYLENKPEEKIKDSDKSINYSAANFGSENMNLENYYDKFIDVTKEIKLPNQILDK